MIVYKLCAVQSGKLVSLTAMHHLQAHELPKRFVRHYCVGSWTQAPRTLGKKKVAPLFCFDTEERARKSDIFPGVTRVRVLKCVARGVRSPKTQVCSDVYSIGRFWEDPARIMLQPPVPGTVLAESVFVLEDLGER